MERCKHGMIPETCAVCQGLTHSTRELEEDDNNMSRWEEEFYEEADGLDFERAARDALDNNDCFVSSALSHDTAKKDDAVVGIECPFCNTVFTENKDMIPDYCKCQFCHRSFAVVDSFIYDTDPKPDKIDELFDRLEQINNEEL